MESSLPSVTMDPRCHLPSTWRDAIGAVLTNRKINEYTKIGYYGIQAKEKAQAKIATKNGIIYRCGCGRMDGVRFLRYNYLPKPDWYCKACLAEYQKQRDLEDSLKNKWKEAAKLEYC